TASAGWLLAEVQPSDERAVALDVDALQVVELAAALAYELEQSAARVVVLLVRLEVLGEVRDPLAQERDLHLGRAGVALVRRVLPDDRGLLDGMEHDTFSRPAWVRAAERGRAVPTPDRERDPKRSPPEMGRPIREGRAVYAHALVGQRTVLPRPY